MKISYLNHMGSDLEVVNDARVSFGAQSDWEWIEPDDEDQALRLIEAGAHWVGQPKHPRWPGWWRRIYRLSERDRRLVEFLARGCSRGDWEAHLQDLAQEEDITSIRLHVEELRRMAVHWTPFAGSIVKLHVRIPIFLARQFTRSEQGRVFNEISRRYVTIEPEFYEPEVWRAAAPNVKQGSSDAPAESQIRVAAAARSRMHEAVQTYHNLLEDGVCPEQARMILPQATYTEMRVTGSLAYWARVRNQRADSHAQREWWTIVEQLDEIIQPLFPVSWGALTGVA